RLSSNALKNSKILIFLCLLVFAGALSGMNEVLLIIGAGAINYFANAVKDRLSVFTGMFFIPAYVQLSSEFSGYKLFLIFLKIGAVLYGSGYVLFAYMD